MTCPLLFFTPSLFTPNFLLHKLLQPLGVDLFLLISGLVDQTSALPVYIKYLSERILLCFCFLWQLICSILCSPLARMCHQSQPLVKSESGGTDGENEGITLTPTQSF